MSEKGISYKALTASASIGQLLNLCEPNMRELISVQSRANKPFSADQLRQIARGAINISYACRNEPGQDTLFELLQGHKPKHSVAELAAFAGLESSSDQKVRDHYLANPKILEGYLRPGYSVNDSAGQVIDHSGMIEPKRALRYYQLQGVRTIISHLGDDSRCLYQAPTGAGKTRTAMAVVARHLLNHGPTKVLWLASTTELVNQACEAFIEEWSNAGDIAAVLYAWHGGGADFKPEHATNKNTMLIASVQLLAQRAEQVAMLRGEISLIIFDEAHQSLAPSYRNIIEQLLSDKRCKLLGLSATPSRAESEEASLELAGLYNHNKIKIDSDGRNPIEFLVEQQFLARAHFEKFDFDLKDTPQPRSAGDDYDQDFLTWLGKSARRNNAIVRYVNEAIETGRRRILVFTPTILSANYCSVALRVAFGRTYSYHISGDLPMPQRNRILAKFKSQDPDPIVLFNCLVLTTGFDAPNTDAVIVARPTRSAPLYAQMVGRALRGPLSGGTEDAYVYTFADNTLKGYNSLADLFESFESAWG